MKIRSALPLGQFVRRRFAWLPTMCWGTGFVWIGWYFESCERLDDHPPYVRHVSAFEDQIRSKFKGTPVVSTLMPTFFEAMTAAFVGAITYTYFFYLN